MYSIEELKNQIQHEALLGYLAGVLDSEGSVMIKRTSVRFDCKNPQYIIQISVKMTDEMPLRLFKQMFGGCICEEKKVYQSKFGFKTNSRLFRYDTAHKNAANVLRTLLPYLLVKSGQAKLALDTIDLKREYKKRENTGKVGGQPYSKELISKLDQNWMRVKELNHSRYV